MANPFGSKFVQHSVEDENKVLQQRAEENTGGEKSARIRIRDGINVIWVLPKVGTMVSPVEYRFVHYNPFHLCRRDNPYPDPNSEDTTKLVEDKRFSKCVRCQKAWTTWSDLGKPRNCEEHENFKRDMPSIQGLVQAVNLTSFFGPDSSRKFAVPNVELVEKWGDAFVEAIRTGVIPEGMPEDMAEDARAGVNALFVNEKLGTQIRSAYISALVEDEKGEDPLFHPESTLLQIIRGDSGETFQVRGQTRKSKAHEVRFTLPKFMKDWKIPAGFIDVCVDKAQDLNNLEVAGDTVEDRARALRVLTDEEITELLNNANHSYTSAGGENSELTGEDAAAAFSNVPVDPDNFVSTLATSNRDLNMLRQSKEG